MEVFDSNGNMTSDGHNTYVWNCRDQLQSISGASTASFQYDALGRRINRNLAGQTTSYLYDGPSTIQEQAGAVQTNFLGEVGRNQNYLLTRGTARLFPMTDGNSSALRYVDGPGNPRADISYDPFGSPQLTGGTIPSRQFAEGEADGAGLLYLGARYYSPRLQRFLSEDPGVFSGGDLNAYAYVGNDPVNYADPLGMWRLSGYRVQDRANTIMCNGLGSVEAQVNDYSVDEQRCGAVPCIRAHEDTHVAQVNAQAPGICRNAPRSAQVTFNLGTSADYERALSEIAAHGVGRDCLKNLLRNCTRNDCRAAIRNLLSSSENIIATYTNWLQSHPR